MTPRPAPAMMSLRAGRLFGIPIRVHYSFCFFAVWMLGLWVGSHGAVGAGLMVGVYVCVLIHELAHAMVARWRGIRTTEITINMLGGEVKLASYPAAEDEIWIAIAGPIVNILLGVVLLAVAIVAGLPFTMALDLNWGTFLSLMGLGNLLLGVFNLIPALPLDGGVALRAVLSLVVPYRTAARVAAGIGQTLFALSFIAAAILGQWVWMIFAALLFLASSRELANSLARQALSGRTAGDAARRDVLTLRHGDTLNEASEALLQTRQEYFPVLAGPDVVGAVSRYTIAQALPRLGPDAYVARIMDRNFRRVAATDPMEDLAVAIVGDGRPAMLVEGDEWRGIIDKESLNRLITGRSAPAAPPPIQNA